MKKVNFLLCLDTILFFYWAGSARALGNTFYSLQNTNFPPLPFLPFDVPVYDLGGGFFAYDDTSVNYVQLPEESGPPSPEDGGGIAKNSTGPMVYNYSTNDLGPVLQ